MGFYPSPFYCLEIFFRGNAPFWVPGYFLHLHPMSRLCSRGHPVLCCPPFGGDTPLREGDSGNRLPRSCASAVRTWELIADLPSSPFLDPAKSQPLLKALRISFFPIFSPEAHQTSSCFSDPPYWVETPLLPCEFLPLTSRTKLWAFQPPVSDRALTEDPDNSQHTSQTGFPAPIDHFYSLFYICSF